MGVSFKDILGLLSGVGTAAATGYGPIKAGKSIYNKNRGFFEGSPEQDIRQPRYTGEQDDVLNQLLQQGSQNANFSGMEDLARKRFEEDTIPSLSERFTNMGGGQRSSAFGSSIGRASSDLEAQLGGLRGQFGMQQLGMGLQPRFDTRTREAQPGFNQQIIPILMMLAKMGMAGMGGI